MLTKVKDKALLTKEEAKKKYNTKHFMMIFTEGIDETYLNARGYVIFTYDKPKEGLDIPREEYENKVFTILEGWDLDPEPQIGNVVYYD